MNPVETIGDLFTQLGTELSLKWDGKGSKRPILMHDDQQLKTSPVGPFNMIRPNRIQIIGPPEQTYLQSLKDREYLDCLQQVFNTQPAAIIFTDNLTPHPKCARLAAETDTPLLYTTQQDHRVLNRLLAFFNQPEQENTLVQGVFMEVLGKGVLLTGDPSVGKSELALELISRGHRLIADDATEFSRINNHTLNGRCPPVLQDFLEVRGLGLLNIRAMFGNSAIKPSKYLHLIVHLQYFEEKELAAIDHLNGSNTIREIL